MKKKYFVSRAFILHHVYICKFSNYSLDFPVGLMPNVNSPCYHVISTSIYLLDIIINILEGNMPFPKCSPTWFISRVPI